MRKLVEPPVTLVSCPARRKYSHSTASTTLVHYRDLYIYRDVEATFLVETLLVNKYLATLYSTEYM